MTPTNDDWARALAGPDRNAAAYAIVTAIGARIRLEARRCRSSFVPPLDHVAEWLGMSPAVLRDAIAVSPRGAEGTLRLLGGFVELTQ